MSRITAPEPKVILSSRYPNPQDLLGRPQFTQHREGWLECNLGRQTGEALFVALWAVGHPASSCLSLSMALQQQGLKGTWNSPVILGPLFPFPSHTPAAELFSITAPWGLYRALTFTLILGGARQCCCSDTWSGFMCNQGTPLSTLKYQRGFESPSSWHCPPPALASSTSY